MKVNRSIAPEILPIKNVQLLNIQAQSLRNGLDIYQLEGGDIEVVSMQLVFPAGRWSESKPMQAFLTSSVLPEGTSNKTSKQISEIVDFHGAEFSISASYDIATVSIICLVKHIEPMLNLLREVLTQTTFPEQELMLKKKIAKQTLLVNSQKTDFVAQREFHKMAFGAKQPYGYSSSAEKFDAIHQSDLVDFYQSQFQSAKPFAVIAGKCPPSQFKMIVDTLSSLPTGQAQENFHTINKNRFSTNYIPFENANQTSIRLGRTSIKPSHPDFSKLQLANAILGGYFGSRLMSNLREEKGLTYGVSSHLGSFVHQGYWFVTTDVGKEHRELALNEIKNEIEKLQTELVTSEELELVRNYLMGKKLRSIDGPFSQARLYKSLLIQGQSADDFQNRVDQTLSTTTKDIQEMAQKYFPLNEMVEVMVG